MRSGPDAALLHARRRARLRRPLDWLLPRGGHRGSLLLPAGSRILRRMVVIGIAVAGALGALARYGLDELDRPPDRRLPVGDLRRQRHRGVPDRRAGRGARAAVRGSRGCALAVVTGFLGAYTTFSTFSLDTYRLLEEGHAGPGDLQRLRDAVPGLLAVWLGLKVGRGLSDPERLKPLTPARSRASSMIRSASARLPKPRVSVFPDSRSL